MKTIDIEIDGIEERGVVAELPYNLKLDLIYNNFDNYIYISILDDLNNRITGFQKLVPNIDFFNTVRNNRKLQLRCIKINEFAEEKDFITPKNLNKDYKLFLIGDDE